MKQKGHVLKKVIAGIAVALVSFAVLFEVPVMKSHAVAFNSYDPASDIDYTNGEAKNVVLTRKKTDKHTVAYELTDYRITRNATIWMSMNVKFDNPWSWGIKFRNIDCKLDGKAISGDVVFRFFPTSGTVQVNGKNAGIDKWASYSNIADNEWHQIVVCSEVNDTTIWIDGKKAIGTYFSDKVTEISSNYAALQIFMAGENSGTIKDICIWNDGKAENPVMPADKVVQAISKLPDPSVAGKYVKNIDSAQKMYDALSKKEKSYVVNYGRLEQASLALSSNKKAYALEVTGTKKGEFNKLFKNGSFTHKVGDDKLEYIFESALSRKSTYYMQFTANLTKFHCFDVYLRRQKHTVDGTQISGLISIRFFEKNAVVVDSKGKRISNYTEFKTPLTTGTHTITVLSSPTACSFWIDGQRYDFKEYGATFTSEDIVVKGFDYIAATPGFAMNNSEEWGAFGTIGNITVWNDNNTASNGQNCYSSGDKERIAIFNLPSLNQITLNHKSDVKAARSAYNEIDKATKKYVTNIEKLERSERAIKLLEDDPELAKSFLSDDLPQITADSVNLISTATVKVPSQNSADYAYNLVSHDLSLKNAEQYVTATFEGLKGISANDAYLIKFKYTPYEYYFETPTASWMGLRVTFSGYTVGGGGSKFKNYSQFAFMVKDGGIITMVNGSNIPTEYLGGMKIDLSKSHDVTMLCHSGKMKIWVNGKPIAYFDNLVEYPVNLEFTSSKCRCDVSDIQIYNYKDVEPFGIFEEDNSATKIINDILYDTDGKVPDGQLNRNGFILICLISATVIVITLTAFVVYFAIKKKSFLPKNK